MSGKLQHYLPQFLLRGFSSRNTTKEQFCWVYRRNSVPFEPNIKGIGAENYFYGKSDSGSTDEKVTNEETELGELLSFLRVCELEGPLKNSNISELLTHLSLRTKHLRSTFTDAARVVLNRFEEKTQDHEWIKQQAINEYEKDPKGYIKKAIQDLEKKQARKLTMNERFLATNALKARIVPSAQALDADDVRPLRHAIKHLGATLSDVSKEGHNKALLKSTSPEQRVKRLKTLSWQVHEFGEHELILGDMGPWAVETGVSTPIELAWTDSELASVVLPISHSRALVGVVELSTFKMSARELNNISASLSSEFFISSANSESREMLALNIGQTAGQRSSQTPRRLLLQSRPSNWAHFPEDTLGSGDDI